MSLTNDALKRAKETPQKKASDGPPFKLQGVVYDPARPWAIFT
jgi:hypothetical protein